MRKYSHSAFKTFQRCAKKWSYLYIDKIVPKTTAKYMERGITLHEHLAVLYDDSYEGAVPEVTDEDAEVLERYFAKYHDDDAWEVISIEEDYEFEINGYPIVFKPDLVVRINDEVWIVDHKTSKTIPDEWDPYNMTDFQHLLYVAGMRSKGYDVKGFIFNYIRTKPPTQPTLTKAGDRIAYLAKMDTDYDTLLEFATEHGMVKDPAVQEKLSILKHAPDKFFQRHYLMVPDEAVDNMLDDVWEILSSMNTAELFGRYPRHVVAGFAGAMACSKCPYQPVCHAELMGIDAEEVVLNLYKEKEKRK